MRRLWVFFRDERGTSAIEYSVIATLIALAIIAGARTIGTNLSTKYYAPVANNLT